MKSFPKLKLIAVGKIKKHWIQDGIAVYLKRIPELEIVEIKDTTPQKEGEVALSLLKPNQKLVALMEEGKTYSSEQFAEFLSRAGSNEWVLLIGSAEGLSPEIKQRADYRLSLSPMTFPHELARLMLVEQLYRAKTILQGGKYHK